MFTALMIIYWLALSIWIGGMVIFTFLTTPSIFQNFPREQAGEVVGVLIPRYFMLGMVAAVVLLATYLAIRHFSEGPLAADKVRVALLLVMLAGAGASGLAIGPKAQGIKVEIKAAQSEEAKAPLRKEFSKIHGISMMVNLLVMLAGLATIVIGVLYPLKA